MPRTESPRQLALTAAHALVERQAVDDAIALLCAWAASGPNDASAHELLTEATRLDPRSALAQQAFERLEGMGSSHPLLDAAISKFTLDEVRRILRPPTQAQRGVQIGFNNNVKYRGATYHIQTEDSGPAKAYIITHLFADGGRIIKSVKREYRAELERSDIVQHVRNVMKMQQLEMALALRSGEVDAALEKGGGGEIEVRTHPPKIDLQRVATQREEKIDASGKVEEAQSERTLPTEETVLPMYFRLELVRCLWGGPSAFEPRGASSVIGRRTEIDLSGEPFCGANEARLEWRRGRLWLQDEPGGCGVFMRIRKPTTVAFGDEFLVGDQLLLVDSNPDADDKPDPGPTLFFGSPRQRSPFRITQQFEGGASGTTLVARSPTVVIGRTQADFVVVGDPLDSETHCAVVEENGTLMLVDLGSRTGVFVRIKGEQQLVTGDEIVVGRTRMLVDVLDEPNADPT